MVNVLGVYNPIFYAQEALRNLEKALGMANRVHRGFEQERRTFGRGEVISIRKPAVFTVADAPATAEDLVSPTVNITLDKWRETKFKLTDKELAFTQQRIVDEHIRPMAYALADDIDQDLTALYADVPHVQQSGGTALDVADITQTRKVMFNNAAPVDDFGRVHLMVNGSGEADLLAEPAFSQQQGAGDVGVNTQLRGSLGTKFGFEVFANQNSQSAHSEGNLTPTGAISVGTTTAVGDTTIDITAATSFTGTINVGDMILVTTAGTTYRYAVTAAATGTPTVTVPISPPSRVVHTASTDVVTLDQEDTKFANNLAFHRNAFALVMAPLPSIGNELGANVATVTDPVTGLSLRSRLYYQGNDSQVHVAIDALWGVKTIDADMACRLRNAT